MKIKKVNLNYIPEKLKAPFGFKGGYLSELWQVIAKIEDYSGNVGVGVGVQSVLWSDANIFKSYSETEGNTLMYKISKKALELLTDKEGENPIVLIDSIYNELLNYAHNLCGENLRETFVRNALVCVDNALWNLYSKEKQTKDLIELIPKELRASLNTQHKLICNIPLISYGVTKEEIKQLLDNGSVLLKIKIGNDNNGNFTIQEMINWDIHRLKLIDEIAKNYSTEYTVSNKVLYYLDANGKYDSKESLNQFLDFARKENILKKIVLLEEPFDENNRLNVSDLNVRIVADESVHSSADVEERIKLGYGAIALKPIAKTLSETLKILKIASKHNIPCFCADLTVNPLMVEINKNIASRIDTIAEMKIGILESNGEQNYINWEDMKKYSPSHTKSYSKISSGLYSLDEEFFKESGGIFDNLDHYSKMI